MDRPLRIGNACGFWGDRLDAAAEMLAAEPDLDYLTLDFLAEVSMSILTLQQSRDPAAGWPRDFIEIIRSIAPYWRNGGRCRLITNAGGLDPHGCARACVEVLESEGCQGRRMAIVSGDGVLDRIRSPSADSGLSRNSDTGEVIDTVRDRLVTANAYLGAQPLVEALALGADLVITGRVADPSLTVAPCVHEFGWRWNDWDRLAGATVAGHLIECGTQVTGGISTDWLDMPDVQRVGFPIVEVNEDGSCVVTKPRGTGGRVCEQTVKEQLVYEIGDPDEYLSPDVTVSFLSLQVNDQGNDRVRVSGARGRPPSQTYKVSATYRDGFRCQGQLLVFGGDAAAKARRAAEVVFERLRHSGVSLRETVVECLGTGECCPQGTGLQTSEKLQEIVLRIAVADDTREAVERFARELMPLITAGPPGTTGYAEGRPRVHPLFRFWPCLIERERTKPQVELLESVPVSGATGFASAAARTQPITQNVTSPKPLAEPLAPDSVASVDCTNNWRFDRSDSKLLRRLRDIAYARSGDKGIHANIGVVARQPDHFAELCGELSAERVASYLGVDAARVTRYELANLAALNFVVRGVLANPLRADAQGKALAQVLLDLPLEESRNQDLHREPKGTSTRFGLHADTQNSAKGVATNLRSVPGASPPACAAEQLGMAGPVLIVEQPDAAMAVLTLNRPERRNALTIDLMQRLCENLQSLASQPPCRVVILHGSGQAFCAGLDLDEAAQPELIEQSAEWVARTFQTLAQSPLVTIAAAHGAAYAGGAGLLASCDLVVAADDLRICFPEVRRGLAPALAAAALARRLRDGELRELLLLCDPIDVQRAMTIGMVQRAVPGDKLLAEARRIATSIVQGSPEAVRRTKRLLNELAWAEPSRHFAQALEFHKIARAGEEAREGLAAFREHRKPNWSPGRE